MGSAHRMNGPYQAFKCADGYVTVGANTDRLFLAFCDALGHPEWTQVPEFGDNTGRVRHRARLAKLIEGVMTGQPRQRWLDLFDAREIPCGPINDYSEVFASPQVFARELVRHVDHPTLGRLRTLGSPIKMSETPPNPDRRAPLLGEHNDQVLVEAGFNPAEIAALHRSGAVPSPD